MGAKTVLTSLVFLLVCCLHPTTGQADDQRVVVETMYGFVRGRVRQTDTGARVNEFLGIPYTPAPVGDLRFKRAKDAKNWTGTIEADKMPPACLQYSEHPLPWFDLDPGQSEDCLYLNIWAPADTGYWMRPVKIFIHGGGWFEGGSNRLPYYDGFPEAVDTLDENGNSTLDGIVVVTMNYRLGALGFLSPQLADYPGNLGIGDIDKAFLWVARNIRFFGGDNGENNLFNGNRIHANKKDRISRYPMTVVGHGSGSMALSLLQIQSAQNSLWTYPRAVQVVLDGMSFLTLKALEGVDNTGESSLNNVRLTAILAKKLGCPDNVRDDPAATMECLKGVDASRLVRCAASMSRGRGPPNVFLPQIFPAVSHYITNPFLELKYQNSTTYRDAYASFTSEAGSALLITQFPKVFGELGEKDEPLTADCAKKVARRALRKFPQNVADDLLGDLDIEATTANRDKLVEVLGDAYFKCPMVFYGESRNSYKKTLKDLQPPKFFLLEKQVNPPYNPFASWMGSVWFNTAQINFPHPDGQITVNNKTYTYSDEQKEQLRVNQDLLRSYIKEQKLPLPEFTKADPAYSVMSVDGKISDKKTNYHSRNCEMLRPYFDFHRDTYDSPYAYEAEFWLNG